MRRLVAILLCLASAALGTALVAVVPAAHAQPVPPDDPSRGLIYSGLRRAGPGSPCEGLFEIVTRGRAGEQRTRCSHGPDPVPPDLDPRPGQDPAFQAGEPAPGANGPTAAADGGSGGCSTDTGDAYRVQLIYAREASEPDRFSQFEASFRAWAARVDDVFNTSAAKTGGIRHVRYVTDASCQPVINQKVISAAAVDNVETMAQDFDNAGLDRADRKYMVWVDTPKALYCGQGFSYPSDTRGDPTPGVNKNNGNAPGLLARVDRRCWGQTNLVEAHELLHTLGGVLRAQSGVADSPPNATNHGHCTDESDRLCYADGGGNPVTGQVFRADGTPTSMRFGVCPASNEALLDCGNDDYFSTNPPAGNWLATHWNTANSAWLNTVAPLGTPGSATLGTAWYSDGLDAKSGPAGTTIRVYGAGLIENLPYKLVTGRDGGNAGQPCRADLVPVNNVVRYSNSSGSVGTTVGTVDRLPGTYQVCFAQIDPVTDKRAVSGAITFTVT